MGTEFALEISGTTDRLAEQALFFCVRYGVGGGAHFGLWLRHSTSACCGRRDPNAIRQRE